MAFPSSTVPVAGSLVLVGAQGYGPPSATTSYHEPGLYIVLGVGSVAGTFIVTLAGSGNPMAPMMQAGSPVALPQARILAVWNSD
jgi:hypothetical protein